ncbi:MAG: sucrase ferredoxin [Pseudonocardiaceae bacterium]|nr:sucrase ferredoxin [Pseudonocardiaceae bacterium]
MTTTGLPRCADLAGELGESPAGSAPPIRSLLLVEHPGPWPKDVGTRLLDDALDEQGRAHLQRLRSESGLRPLLIRRPGGREAPVRPAVFVGGCTPAARWLERIPVRDYRDLARLDLDAVAHGQGGLGEPVDGPLLLVCTHGRKDACCAVRGRPLAAALARHHREQTWECTHFGGDRFAGNLLMAPHGLLFGPLEPATAVGTVDAVLAGQVPLASLRGRSGIPPFAQHAEIAVRARTGFTGLDEVLAGDCEVDGDEAAVEVHTTERGYRVRLRRRPLGVHGSSSCAGAFTPTGVDVLAVEPEPVAAH